MNSFVPLFDMDNGSAWILSSSMCIVGYTRSIELCPWFIIISFEILSEYDIFSSRNSIGSQILACRFLRDSFMQTTDPSLDPSMHMSARYGV